MTNADNEFVLCYVDPPWAFFTDQKLSEQWGNDWDDVPYEHNAERPYEHNGQKIVRLAMVQLRFQVPVFHFSDLN